jgi:hypothetical protein
VAGALGGDTQPVGAGKPHRVGDIGGGAGQHDSRLGVSDWLARTLTSTFQRRTVDEGGERHVVTSGSQSFCGLGRVEVIAICVDAVGGDDPPPRMTRTWLRSAMSDPCRITPEGLAGTAELLRRAVMTPTLARPVSLDELLRRLLVLHRLLRRGRARFGRCHRGAGRHRATSGRFAAPRAARRPAGACR